MATLEELVLCQVVSGERRAEARREKREKREKEGLKVKHKNLAGMWVVFCHSDTGWFPFSPRAKNSVYRVEYDRYRSVYHTTYLLGELFKIDASVVSDNW